MTQSPDRYDIVVDGTLEVIALYKQGSAQPSWQPLGASDNLEPVAQPVPEPITGMVMMKGLALRAVVIAALVLTADESLKIFVRARLPLCDIRALGGCARLDVVGPLHLVRTENAGSALGYAQGWQIWLLLAALGLVLVPLYARRLRSGAWLAAAPVGLQIGGAAGNLLDRVVLGGATDMLYVGFGLVWNLADVALAAGTLLATALLVRPARSPTAG